MCLFHQVVVFACCRCFVRVVLLNATYPHAQVPNAIERNIHIPSTTFANDYVEILSNCHYTYKNILKNH